MADPERQLATLEYWAMGSLGGITSQKLIYVMPVVVLGIIGMFLLKWKATMLSLSEQEAMSLGVEVSKTRILVLFVATLTVATIVSVTGLIAFVGLIAPHIARLMLKDDHSGAIILSPIVGAVLLTTADCIAKSVSANEIPISVITSLIGAPVLAILICGGDSGE